MLFRSGAIKTSGGAVAFNGATNTGGGGGSGYSCGAGGSGGSGIVIVRYAQVPTISAQPSAYSKTTSQSVTFSVTAAATGAVAGDLTYQWRKNGTNISGATGSTYTISSTVVADAGTYSVVVKNYGASLAVSSVTSSDAVLTMSQGSQTITFGTIAGKTYGDAAFSLGATASSGLAVSYASTTTDVCTVSGSTLTIVSNGTCSITASQAGDVNWLAATDVSQSFTVSQIGRAHV